MSIRRHRFTLWLTAACIAVGAALPASAPAAIVSFTTANALVYQAAPGEENHLKITRSEADYECGELMPACVVLSERFVAITSFPPDRCMRQTDQETTIECAVPASVVAHLGDGADTMHDWDGPSVINAGDGNDRSIYGLGGDDRLYGQGGSDNLHGNGGDDMLDGGAEDDYLDGLHSGEPSTGGRDTYVGGAGTDLVDYDRRTEDLSITMDGAADDGAAGEGDNVGADVEVVHGGLGNDLLVGNASRNELYGRDGNDVIRGGPAEDTLHGGRGADRLFGEDGQDTLMGGDGDDHVDGGAAVDELYGDDVHCAPSECPTGDDHIAARDGYADSVSCGPGEDLAAVDRKDSVTVGELDNCERLDRGPRRRRP